MSNTLPEITGILPKALVTGIKRKWWWYIHVSRFILYYLIAILWEFFKTFSLNCSKFKRPLKQWTTTQVISSERKKIFSCESFIKIACLLLFQSSLSRSAFPVRVYVVLPQLIKYSPRSQVLSLAVACHIRCRWIQKDENLDCCFLGILQSYTHTHIHTYLNVVCGCLLAFINRFILWIP